MAKRENLTRTQFVVRPSGGGRSQSRFGETSFRLKALLRTFSTQEGRLTAAVGVRIADKAKEHKSIL